MPPPRLVVSLLPDGRVHLEGSAPSPDVARRMLGEAAGLVRNDGRDAESGLAFPTPDQVRVLGAQRG
jgi:hypothetical protein